jgi:hypothetical protein
MFFFRNSATGSFAFVDLNEKNCKNEQFAKNIFQNKKNTTLSRISKFQKFLLKSSLNMKSVGFGQTFVHFSNSKRSRYK